MSRAVVSSVLLAGGLLGGSIASTQSIAARLGYHVLLGTGWTVGSIRLYPPWECLFWYLAWAKDPSAWGAAVRQGFDLLTIGILAGVVATLVVRIFWRQVPGSPTSYGSARWATTEEMQRAGILKKPR